LDSTSVAILLAIDIDTSPKPFKPLSSSTKPRTDTTMKCDRYPRRGARTPRPIKAEPTPTTRE